MIVTKRVISNNYRKKLLLNELLASSITESNYNVIVGYEWKKEDQIFSFQITNKQTINLWINLNNSIEIVSQNKGVLNDLNLRYRAYFISNYICCLSATPNLREATFFDELVSLCAYNSINNSHRQTVFSPITDKRIIELRPIDVYCAIRSLTRLIMECGHHMHGEEKKQCDVLINNLLLYTILPEVGYKNCRPVYALLEELIKLQGHLRAGGNKIAQDTPNVNELFKKSAYFSNRLEFEAIMRLSAYTGVCINEKIADDYQEILDCVSLFKRKSVEFYNEYKKVKSQLLEDNYTAIKLISFQIDRLFPSSSSDSGALHYYM